MGDGIKAMYEDMEDARIDALVEVVKKIDPQRLIYTLESVIDLLRVIQRDDPPMTSTHRNYIERSVEALAKLLTKK